MNLQCLHSKVLLSVGVVTVSALILILLFSQLVVGQGLTPPALPPVKATAQAKLNLRRVAAVQTIQLTGKRYLPTPTDEVEETDVPQPATPAGAGFIIDSPDDRFGSDYKMVNSWYEVQGSTTTRVYAGGIIRDPLLHERLLTPVQGVVIVLKWTNLEPSGGSESRTPLQVGAVRIVNAVGEKLLLLSETGVPFVFDVATQSFVKVDCPGSGDYVCSQLIIPPNVPTLPPTPTLPLPCQGSSCGPPP